SLQELGRQAGVPVKFRLCDTMGFGLPWPEASLPRGVPRLVQFFTRTLGVEPESLEWHGHNDFHRAEVNTVAAWLNGCAAANYPFAGAGFNVTSAGIHADGLLKNEEIYNIFDTARILDRPLGITVNDRSGLAGITYWLNTSAGLRGAAQVRKDDPRVVAIHQ